MSHADVGRDPSPGAVSHFGLVFSFSALQDMCKIALMYCRLIKARAEALSLSEQNEGKAANRVGIGAGPTARGEAGFGCGFWAEETSAAPS